MDVAARTTTEIEATNRRERLPEAFWDNIGIGISTGSIALAILTVVLSLFLAIKWYNQPFLGGFVSPTLVVNSTRPVNDNQQWPGADQGLRAGDRIVALNDVTFNNLPAEAGKFNELLSQLSPGTVVSVQIFRPSENCPTLSNNQNCLLNLSIQSGQLPVVDFLVQFGVPYVTAVIMLVMGMAVWVLRRQQVAGRLVVNLCAAGAVVLVGRFDIISSFQIVPIWLYAICGLGADLFATGVLFPYPLGPFYRRRWLRIAAPASFILVFVAALLIYQTYTLQVSDAAQLIALAMTLIAGVFLILMMWLKRRDASSPRAREQASIVFLCAFAALLPSIFWLATVVLHNIFGWTWISFSSVFAIPPTIIFPLGFAYAVLQYRTLQTDRIVSEGIIYLLLGGLLVIGYALITTAVYLLTAGTIPPNSPILIGATLFIIALAFTPARVRLERLVDRSFFRQRRVYEQRLESFAQQLTSSVEMSEIVSRTERELIEGLSCEYAFVFLRLPPSEEFEVLPNPITRKRSTDVRFKANSGLVSLLRSDTSVVRLGSGEAPVARLMSDRARLAILNTPLIIRLRSARRFNGFLALGPSQARAAYGPEELRYLEALANQVASAVDRAQMVVEAQANERQLRVLGQISASLNIVMDFDTLLEFIYNQVDKVIDAPNFYIAFHDQQNNDLYYAFYQEGGERLPEKEGFRWQMGRDLFSEVIRSQQPLRTDNFAQETHRRDARTRIENPNLRAWMGVPLNASEGQVLGCLAVATTDPGLIYTDEQIGLFWNIAGLVATALYKTRLFAEAEERARQMKALNDISSRLATEFENLDALLLIITESAVEILSCEAGSLLMKDENSNDLIFTLAVGGSGQDLVGRRIPAGEGIAGTVAQTARHVLVNDTQRDVRWYGDLNQKSDTNRPFKTNSLLAVPLVARGSILGVLEVVNKKNGTNFVEADVNLLTGFASQAAIAIENAQLYKQTDEALSIRLQQLDTMQHIDQELNRTLDLKRVVLLTIENALRESGAMAGALALVYQDPPVFEIAGSIGYPEKIMEPGTTYDITYGILSQVYRTGQSTVVTPQNGNADSTFVETLPGAQSQLAVPLTTGDTVNAVLLLESTKPDAFAITTTSYIQGLAEHANTAITNAQLFARLEQADKDRSEFTSFVVHELRQPMTSIKGFAELLLGGMTGALSEQQQNLIAIIRSNVVRLQQIVADLRDIVAQETNNLKITMSPLSFNNVVVETLRSQQRAIDEKDQKVALNMPENLPMVWGDELRLIQVMTNFVSNAYKYTPPGGKITILAEDVANHWDATGAQRVIHCAVSDTGIGMSEADLQKLGTAYWRSDNPLAREQSGTGLGVRLTRGLIEAHGGKMWVESTLNVGSTFHFTVPLASEAEQAAARSR